MYEINILQKSYKTLFVECTLNSKLNFILRHFSSKIAKSWGEKNDFWQYSHGLATFWGEMFKINLKIGLPIKNSEEIILKSLFSYACRLQLKVDVPGVIQTN